MFEISILTRFTDPDNKIKILRMAYYEYEVLLDFGDHAEKDKYPNTTLTISDGKYDYMIIIKNSPETPTFHFIIYPAFLSVRPRTMGEMAQWYLEELI
jgi:hypothetical protein